MARFLHTRIRVGDLERSIEWYCAHLGFEVRSRSDKSPAGNQIVHLELPGNEHTLELTYSADYQLAVPEDLMHLAIAVPDLIGFCDALENNGIEIWPTRLAHDLPHRPQNGLYRRSRRLRNRATRRLI